MRIALGRPRGPRRVALLTPSWPAGSECNGIVNFVARMRQAFVAHGVEAPVLALAATNRDDDVFKVDRRSSLWEQVLWRILPDRALMSEVTRGIRDAIHTASTARRVDLIQMEESFGWAARVKRGCDLPVVVRLSGPWFLVGAADSCDADRSFRRKVLCEGKGIELADGIISPSKYTLQRVREHYGLSLQMAEVIPNPAPVFSQEEHWCLDHCDRDTVLFVGRFDRVKGGDLIINAFTKVLKERPHAKLRFVGPDRGFVGDNGMRWSLPDYAAEAAPGTLESGQICWLGERRQSELPELRRMAMMTVVCSRFENFPNTLLEAAALGCPLVATAAGGIPEILQHERNGLLCRADDADDLAEKILRLLEHRELAVRLGRQAAIDCHERYDPDLIARRTLDFYGSVLERFRARMAGDGTQV